MLDLVFADQQSLAKSGRSFNCSTCPQAVQAKRRCHEDRWDFTDKDDSAVFPLVVHKGGQQYGFCPGKATWDSEVLALFRTLHVATVSGTMWEQGGLKDQPTWWVDILSWFMQRYDAESFSSKARSVLGDGNAPTGKAKGVVNNGLGLANTKR